MFLRDWFTRWRRPQTLGQRGEAAAARFLKRLGYRIIERGARRRFGEIDLVMVDPRGSAGRTVVFVEVKTRASHDRGHPSEAVDDRKQRKLSLVALAYLKGHGLLECPARFDVVAVTWPADAKKPVIEHYKNAFEVQGGSMFG
ncbi:MAG: YraN family protein [Planctomycetes bacterium]|nr:YraN family protein [Planctomycetota bacterium]